MATTVNMYRLCVDGDMENIVKNENNSFLMAWKQFGLCMSPECNQGA